MRLNEVEDMSSVLDADVGVFAECNWCGEITAAAADVDELADIMNDAGWKQDDMSRNYCPRCIHKVR